LDGRSERRDLMVHVCASEAVVLCGMVASMAPRAIVAGECTLRTGIQLVWSVKEPTNGYN